MIKNNNYITAITHKHHYISPGNVEMRPTEVEQRVVVLCQIPQRPHYPLPPLLVPVEADVDHDGGREGDAVEDHAVVVRAGEGSHVHAEVTDKVVVTQLEEST